MDALYQVQARVAFARLAPEPLVGLTVLGAERIQQREYVRVPLSTIATGMYLGSTATSAQEEPLHLQVHDLSASGLRGRSDRPLAPGDDLTLDLPLPRPTATQPDQARFRSPRPETRVDQPVHLRGRVVELLDLPEPLNLRARVVRLIENSQAQDLRPEIGVVFLDLTRETRERIIRFALDVQRERRRRGMM
jgi:c-di-GMP-binding flagellar brake protein YcgR